jgi:glyoxylase-like metal-dependent hydrolase (beta-lactamase superfamily II)
MTVTAATALEQVTKNVFTTTKIRGCNPSIVFTKEGSVFIDTAQWLTTLLEMKEFALQKGPIRYLINTEAHIDHIFGNHWFAGVCPVIGHEKLHEIFWQVPGDMNAYDYSVDVIKRQDPGALHLMPSQKDYVFNPPSITFSDRMSFKLGDHTFKLYFTPGHSPSQICVHVPEERVVFVGDTIFANCQMWLHSGDIDQLVASLKFLGTLDVDHIVPGHGPVVTKDYLNVQLGFIYEWIGAVAAGISKGWSQDECIERINFKSRYPVDIGQDESMDYIQRTNVIKCYKYITTERSGQ